MTGIGAMDYGDAAERGKLADNYNQNQNYNSSFTNSNSSSQQQQQQQQQDPGGGFTSGNGGRKFRPGEGSQSTGW
jgi:hypothetical protein